MYFAEFYTKGVMTGELIPACGDRSVLILDGRESRSTHVRLAQDWAVKHDYPAFKICQGPSFTNARTLTGLIEVDKTAA